MLEVSFGELFLVLGAAARAFDRLDFSLVVEAAGDFRPPLLSFVDRVSLSLEVACFALFFGATARVPLLFLSAGSPLLFDAAARVVLLLLLVDRGFARPLLTPGELAPALSVLPAILQLLHLTSAMFRRDSLAVMALFGKGWPIDRSR